MFTLTKESLRLAHINVRDEKHGDEDVLAVDLKLELETSNAVLLKLSPTLRDAFYTQDPNATKDLIDPSHAPVLRNPQLGKIKWSLEMPFVRFAVLKDGSNDEEIISQKRSATTSRSSAKRAGRLFSLSVSRSRPRLKWTSRSCSS